MANLAIKGHETRGKEIIGFLRMLGANNTYQLSGDEDYAYYVIEKGEIRVGDIIFGNEPYIMFTLEEFLEKFPYKVGDKVNSKHIKNCKIEKAEWVSSSNRVIYKLQGFGWHSVEDLQPYKEENVEEQKKDYDEWFPTDYLEFENNDDTWADEVEINLGQDHEIQFRGDKTFIVKKKPQYPKTYVECCKIVNASSYVRLVYDLSCGQTYSYDVDNLQHHENIRRLKICRDAYWKIAGEQMGLGKSWEPDWDNEDKRKHVITCQGNNIIKDTYFIKNTILAFPTEEMRDAFYENFKDLIEECKEFL